jgi:hypothetical protein
MGVADGFDATGGHDGGPGENGENCLFHMPDNATENARRVKHDSSGSTF